MTRHLLTFLLALGVSGLLIGCETSPPDPVLATFPGGEVTQSEVNAYFAGLREHSLEPRDVLRHLAFTESLAQTAQADGLDQNLKLALRLARLEDFPWVATLKAKITAEGEPTAEAIAEYLEANRTKLSKPRKVRLWNIFKRAPSNAPPAERAAVRGEMEAIHRRLVAGEDFSSIAKVESEAVNRHRGGRMGALPPGEIKSELEAVGFALAEGEISPVTGVDDGFVILRNAGFVEATTMSEEEAVERIRTAMRRWNFEAAWEALRLELFEAAGVAVFDDAITDAQPQTEIGTVDGDAVTYSQIDALARSQGVGSQPERLTASRIRAVFLAQAFTRLAAERSRGQGLTPAPESMARVLWQRRLILAASELERRVEKEEIEISDEEARAFFTAAAPSFTVPAQALLSIIQLRLDDGGAEPLRSQTSKARETLERIRRGEISFAEAAREVSQHPSAAAGGDVGWRADRWVAGLGPNVRAALRGLQPGQVSDVVRQDHLWILQLRDTRPAHALTFEEGRDRARQMVRQQRFEERLRALRALLLAELDSGIEIRALPELPELTVGPGRSRPARQEP